ncbi:MAG: hypothetical protein OXC42_00750 [Gammaproteobacteria bacterium]|nr:hypothetical protein [Gammaproteobacteria bacterium]
MTVSKKSDRRKWNCYISAPIGTNIENIRSSLLERKVQLLLPNDIDDGHDLYPNVLDLITNADLVVGVLTRERRSESVIFEVGQAVALGRQIVVFAPPKSRSIPFNLQQFLVLRISLLNRKAIDFAFDQVLSAPSSPKKLEKMGVHNTRSMGAHIDKFLQKIQTAAVANDGVRFEKIITQAIRESGVEIAVEAPLNSRKADLVVWSDIFQSMFGHPLLVEMKVKLRCEEHARGILRQCAQMTAESGATWSLLIYGDGPSMTKISWTSIAPTVLTIAADDLLSKMRNQSFVNIVRNLRNQRVHCGIS